MAWLERLPPLSVSLHLPPAAANAAQAATAFLSDLIQAQNESIAFSHVQSKQQTVEYAILQYRELAWTEMALCLISCLFILLLISRWKASRVLRRVTLSARRTALLAQQSSERHDQSDANAAERSNLFSKQEQRREQQWKAEREELRQESAAREEHIQKLQAELDVLRATKSKADAEALNDALKAQEAEWMRKLKDAVSELEQRYNIVNAENTELTNTVESNKKELQSRDEIIAQLREEKDGVTNRLQETEKELRAAQEQAATQQRQLADLQQQLDTATKDVETKPKELAALSASSAAVKKSIAPKSAPLASAASATSSTASASESSPSSRFTPLIRRVCNDASSLLQLRAELRQYGVQRFLSEQAASGWVEQKADGSYVMATGDEPSNLFARLVGGQDKLSSSDDLVKSAGMKKDAKRFMIVRNASGVSNKLDATELEWVDNAERHEWMLIRSLNWQMINVATFGMELHNSAATSRSSSSSSFSSASQNVSAASLRQALDLLSRLSDVAHRYTASQGWSKNLGLYFHSSSFDSIHSLHCHMVDLDTVTPAFHDVAHKNLPLKELQKALYAELAQVDSDVVIPHDMMIQSEEERRQQLIQHYEGRLKSVIAEKDRAIKAATKKAHERETSAMLDERLKELLVVVAQDAAEPAPPDAVHEEGQVATLNKQLAEAEQLLVSVKEEKASLENVYESSKNRVTELEKQVEQMNDHIRQLNDKLHHHSREGNAPQTTSTSSLVTKEMDEKQTDTDKTATSTADSDTDALMHQVAQLTQELEALLRRAQTSKDQPVTPFPEPPPTQLSPALQQLQAVCAAFVPNDVTRAPARVSTATADSDRAPLPHTTSTATTAARPASVPSFHRHRVSHDINFNSVVNNPDFDFMDELPIDSTSRATPHGAANMIQSRSVEAELDGLEHAMTTSQRSSVAIEMQLGSVHHVDPTSDEVFLEYGTKNSKHSPSAASSRPSSALITTTIGIEDDSTLFVEECFRLLKEGEDPEEEEEGAEEHHRASSTGSTSSSRSTPRRVRPVQLSSSSIPGVSELISPTATTLSHSDESESNLALIAEENGMDGSTDSNQQPRGNLSRPPSQVVLKQLTMGQCDMAVIVDNLKEEQQAQQQTHTHVSKSGDSTTTTTGSSATNISPRTQVKRLWQQVQLERAHIKEQQNSLLQRLQSYVLTQKKKSSVIHKLKDYAPDDVREELGLRRVGPATVRLRHVDPSSIGSVASKAPVNSIPPEMTFTAKTNVEKYLHKRQKSAAAANNPDMRALQEESHQRQEDVEDVMEVEAEVEVDIDDGALLRPASLPAHSTIQEGTIIRSMHSAVLLADAESEIASLRSSLAEAQSALTVAQSSSTSTTNATTTVTPPPQPTDPSASQAQLEAEHALLVEKYGRLQAELEKAQTAHTALLEEMEKVMKQRTELEQQLKSSEQQFSALTQELTGGIDLDGSLDSAVRSPRSAIRSPRSPTSPLAPSPTSPAASSATSTAPGDGDANLNAVRPTHSKRSKRHSMVGEIVAQIEERESAFKAAQVAEVETVVERAKRQVRELRRKIVELQEEVNKQRQRADQAHAQLTAQSNHGTASEANSALVSSSQQQSLHVDVPTASSDSTRECEEELRARINTLEKQLSEAQRMSEESQVKIDGLETSLDELRKMNEEKAAELKAKQIELEKMQADADRAQSEIERLNTQLREAQPRQQTHQQHDGGEAQSQTANEDQTLQKVEEERKRLQGELDKVTQALRDVGAEIETVTEFSTAVDVTSATAAAAPAAIDDASASAASAPVSTPSPAPSQLDLSGSPFPIAVVNKKQSQRARRKHKKGARTHGSSSEINMQTGSQTITPTMKSAVTTPSPAPTASNHSSATAQTTTSSSSIRAAPSESTSVSLSVSTHLRTLNSTCASLRQQLSAAEATRDVAQSELELLRKKMESESESEKKLTTQPDPELADKVSELTTKLSELEQTLSETQTAARTHEQECNSLRQQLSDAQSALSEANERVSCDSESVSQLRADVARLESELADATSTQSSTESQLNDRIRELEEELKETEERLESRTARVIDLQAEHLDLQREGRDNEARLTAMQTKLDAAQAEAQSSAMKLKEQQANMNTLQADVERMQAETEQLTKQLQQSQHSEDEARKQMHESQHALAELAAEKKKLEEEATKMTQSLQASESALAKLRQEHDRYMSEASEALEHLNEQHTEELELLRQEQQAERRATSPRASVAESPKFESVRNQLAVAQAELEAARSDRTTLEQQLSTAEHELSTLRSHLTQLTRAIDLDEQATSNGVLIIKEQEQAASHEEKPAIDESDGAASEVQRALDKLKELQEALLQEQKRVQTEVDEKTALQAQLDDVNQQLQALAQQHSSKSSSQDSTVAASASASASASDFVNLSNDDASRLAELEHQAADNLSIIKETTKQLNDVRATLDQRAKEIETLQHEVDEKKKQMELERERSATLELQLSEQRKQIQELEEEHRHLQHHVRKLQQQLRDADMEPLSPTPSLSASNVSESNQHSRSESPSLEQEFADLTSQLQSEKDAHLSLRALLHDKEEEVKQLVVNIAERDAAIQQLQEQLTDAASQVEIHKHDIEAAREQYAKLYAEYSDIGEELSEVSATNEEQQQQLEHSLADVTRYKNKYKEANSRLKAMQELPAQLDALEREREAWTQQLLALEKERSASLQMLDKLLKAYHAEREARESLQREAGKPLVSPEPPMSRAQSRTTSRTSNAPSPVQSNELATAAAEAAAHIEALSSRSSSAAPSPHVTRLISSVQNVSGATPLSRPRSQRSSRSSTPLSHVSSRSQSIGSSHALMALHPANTYATVRGQHHPHSHSALPATLINDLRNNDSSRAPRRGEPNQ